MPVTKRFQVILDAKQTTSSFEFYVVDGDNGNVLDITLTDDGAPVDMAGCFVLAAFSKADGRTAEQDNNGSGLTITGERNNVIEIDLYPSSVAPGLVECEIQVYSGTDRDVLITSARFNFDCRRGIVNSKTVMETEEWPVLIGLMKAVEDGEEIRNANEEIRIENEAERIAHDAAFAVWEDYVPGKAYAPRNKVAYAGSSYLCIAATTEAPPDAAYWLLIVEKGMDGTGTGDMLKTTYDVNGAGVVDDAQRLGGKLPEAYLSSTTTTRATLAATAWAENEYVIADDAITTGTTVTLRLAQSASSAQAAAFAAAVIRPTTGAAEAGSVRVSATTSPTVDIPVELVLQYGDGTVSVDNWLPDILLGTANGAAALDASGFLAQRLPDTMALEAWNTLTLQNGFVYAIFPVRYTRGNGICMIEGRITVPSGATQATVIGTLPEGYRPRGAAEVPSLATQAGAPFNTNSGIRVLADGTLRLSNTNVGAVTLVFSFIYLI